MIVDVKGKAGPPAGLINSGDLDWIDWVDEGCGDDCGGASTSSGPPMLILTGHLEDE